MPFSSETKEKIIKSLGTNFLGKRLILFLGKDYLGGSSLEEGFKTIEEYNLQGRKSTFDILGEDATSKEEADKYLEAYKKAVDYFSNKYGKKNISSVSIKPTSICAINGNMIIDETPLKNRLEEFVRYALERNVNVTLDMEDHNWTDNSIDAVQYLWNKGLNISLVLQSRLNRTKNDIENIFKKSYKVSREKLKVRIVIGVYREPEDIATNNRTQAKKRLVENVRQLFDAGIYVKIGTHDHKYIRQIIDEIIIPRKIKYDRFEFQFLKGVQNAYGIEKELMKKGYTVRYYMPVEIEKFDGIPYMIRRILHNPDFMKNGIKNTFQKIFRFR